MPHHTQCEYGAPRSLYSSRTPGTCPLECIRRICECMCERRICAYTAYMLHRMPHLPFGMHSLKKVFSLHLFSLLYRMCSLICVVCWMCSLCMCFWRHTSILRSRNPPPALSPGSSLSFLSLCLPTQAHAFPPKEKMKMWRFFFRRKKKGKETFL